MEELIVSKEELEKWTEKLKKLLEVNSEKRVAEEMDISPSQYSQMKNNGKFPYERFFALMRRNNFSIDDFFNIKDDTCSDSLEKLKIPYFKNNKKYILLQDVENIKGELKVIKKNDQFIVFNTTIKKFTNDGIYVFMQSNFIIVRKIKFSININDFEKLELELIDINNEKDSKIINLENLEKINIIGKVEYIIEKKEIK